MAGRKGTGATRRGRPKAAPEMGQRIEVRTAQGGVSMRELLLAHHLINEVMAALRMRMAQSPAAFFQNPYASLPVHPGPFLYGPGGMQGVMFA